MATAFPIDGITQGLSLIHILAETGQHRVDGNVVNCQIEESLLLRLALQAAEEGEEQQYGVAEYFHTMLI